MTSLSTRTIVRSAVLAAAFLMVLPWYAFADNVSSDSDTLDSDADAAAAAVALAPSALKTLNVGAFITYSGSSHVTFPVPVTISTNVPWISVASSGRIGGYGVENELKVSAGVTAPGLALSCGTSQTLPAGKITFTATDPGFGKTSSSSNDVVVNLTVVGPACDTTPPVITPNVAGTVRTNGWYVPPVTISWTVADAESAVTSTSGCGDTTLGTDNAGVSLTCTATSAGGTSSASVTIQIDKTPPTITHVLSGTLGNKGWYRSSVDVNFQCDDAISGVSSCGPDTTLSVEGSNTATGTAVDLAGNSSGPDTVTVSIDTVKPTISASAGTYTGAWTNHDVTLSFSCSDATSGIAVCPGADTYSDEGAYGSTARAAEDNAGNKSDPSNTIAIQIDKTPPTITHVLSGTLGNNAWYRSSVGVDFQCADAVSDIASCGPDTTLSAEGSNTGTGTAVDLAGNTASDKVNVNIDTVAPTVVATLPSPILLHGVYSVTANATDAGSGVALGTLSCGSVDTSTVLPPHTVTCTASDNAGNTGSVTLSYSVTYDVACFFSPFKATTPLPSGTFKSGSTIPLKCTAKDANGAIVSTATISAAAWLSSTTEPITDAAVDTGSANGDTTFFRYDPIAQQYIFNWSTKLLKTGTYTIRATFDDGSTSYATAYLK